MPPYLSITMFWGKIYRISNTKDDKVYIGSTKCRLETRFFLHKQSLDNDEKAELYVHMRKHGKENFNICLLNCMQWETLDEMRLEEARTLLKIPRNRWLNMKIPHKNFSPNTKHCECCNCEVKTKHFARHCRTKKHLSNQML
jgi:hypothetical protein